MPYILNDDDLTIVQRDMAERGEIKRVGEDSAEQEQEPEQEREEEPVASAPTPATNVPTRGPSVTERFEEFLATDRLSKDQRALIASLEVDARQLTLEQMRDIASKFGLPEDQQKLARIAATEPVFGRDPFAVALGTNVYEPDEQALEAGRKRIAKAREQEREGQ